MLRRGRCFALWIGLRLPQLQAFRQLSHASFLYKLTVGRVKLKLLKMKKVMFTALAVGLCLSANVMAQVPSYVPTNGLVGYWPFNGNANDASGNGNNGTNNGATLTADRFGNANKAYSFDGVDDFINAGQNITFSNYTISSWVLLNTTPDYYNTVVSKISTNFQNYELRINDVANNITPAFVWGDNSSWLDIGGSTSFPIASWHQLVVSFNSNNIVTLYVDGIAVSTSAASNYSDILGFSTYFGARPNTQGIFNSSFYLNGKLDDIGIWNRALTQQEITVLYNSCTGNEITTQPINSFNSVGANAQFSVNAVAGSAFQWQSNPANFGWQNVPNNSSYSGGTTNTLTVSNTSISNHNQPFRAIVNAGGCIDTSDVAQIIIGDTCLTTVTDTLVINATLSLPAPNNENTILIYPNPASDHITIDNGNYTSMAGYTIKIENNAGQQVFQSLINQAQFYVDLSTWSGNGLYFVHLIDAQGNTVTVRKIVLQ